MPNDNDQVGLYVPNTYVWDVQQVNDVNVNGPEFKELLIRMYQNINLITISLNLKDSGYYNIFEFAVGSMLFPNPVYNSSTSTAPDFRNIFRLVVNFGELPDTASTSVAHNLTITEGYSFLKIYGAASDQVALQYIPLPYASATGTDNIEVDVDSTNVTITTASDRTNFTTTYIILEYVKF